MASPRRKRVTDADLSTIISKQIDDARMYDGSDRASYRDKAISYYNGECKDVPAQQGRSQIVSKDVADVHGMIMPGLKRVFFGSEHIAVYEPTRQEHEAFAQQATDYVNYIVMRECDGFRELSNGMSDGVLIGNGVIKHWWDDTAEYTTHEYTGLDDSAFLALIMDEDVVEVLEHTERDDPAGMPPPDEPDAVPVEGPDGPDGNPPLDGGEMVDPMAPQGAFSLGDVPSAPKLHDCKIKRLVSSGRLRIASVPDEEFLIERNAKTLDEDNCRFAAHRRLRTRSDLIKDGYDRKKVESLAAYQSTRQLDEPERDNRSLSPTSDNSPDRSTDLIEVHECYVLMDANGDGVAEWMRVIMAGGIAERTILEREEWGDDLPFSDIVPDPKPHTRRGRSIFDEVEDIQRVKTVLTRGYLDNMYWTLNPQRAVLSNSVDNMDELISPTFGGNIIVKSLDAVKPIEVPYIGDKVLQGIQYADAVIERRTGVSQRTQTLDMDALQNQTATAVNAVQDMAHSKIEEYARNIAECGGLKRVFKQLLKLIVKHQDRKKTIKLRGKWVDMDPKSWSADMQVTINTGLGAGNRERDIQMLAGIKQSQELFIANSGDPFNKVLNIGHWLETCRKMVEASGIRNPDSYFPELSQDQVAMLREEIAKTKPPDPKMLELQMKGQLEAGKMQMQAQLEGQKMQADLAKEREQALISQQSEQAKLDRQAMIEERQAQADIAVKERESQQKAELERQKFEFSVALETQKFEFEKQLKIMDYNARREDAARNAEIARQQAMNRPQQVAQ